MYLGKKFDYVLTKDHNLQYRQIIQVYLISFHLANFLLINSCLPVFNRSTANSELLFPAEVMICFAASREIKRYIYMAMLITLTTQYRTISS